VSRQITLVREDLEDRDIANWLPLARRGIDVRVVATRRSRTYASTGCGLPVTHAQRIGDLFGRGALARRAERLISRGVDPGRALGLERLLRVGDVVCVNETHIGVSAQVATLARHRPDLLVVVTCYENVPFRYEEDPVVARRKDAVRRWAHRFVAATPGARDALCVEGVEPSRIEVQPFGVDSTRFAPERRDPAVRERWGAGDDDVVVLYAGRLLREKGLVELLLACADLDPARFLLVLVGDGPEELRLRRAASSLRLDGRVVFTGWQPWDDMPRLMASADVFAMPSLPTPYWEEQLGFSLVEAMASGLPVLSTASGAMPYVVGRDAGLLIEPYGRAPLRDALQALVADREQRVRLGAAGRRKVETELDSEVVAMRLESLIDGWLRDRGVATDSRT
jgi:glycosyltransferase involved in cell wall biosynthesis